jgi:hypothetical protein
MGQAGADAAPTGADAPVPQDSVMLLTDAAGCPISTGVSPAIDGTNDLADYPAAQMLTLGAPLGSSDAAAVAWDKSFLYVTVGSGAFASAYEPLHVYVQVADGALPAAAPSMGKEYSNLVPALPFTATHLIAARRVDDSGTGPYDAVFVPTGGWTMQQTPLADGTSVFVSSDQQQLSLKVPWTALGGYPTMMRLAFHIVHAVTGNEWKDVVPSTSTPWLAPGGGYYEIDLTGATAVVSWTLR